MSLERFISAQDSSFSGYKAALAELRSGQKTGHWIWYVFPQLAGLGGSSMSRTYAIRDLEEAVGYLRHPTLRSRLLEATAVVGSQLHNGVPLESLMGSPLDARKLVSSLTLFEIAAGQLAPAENPDEIIRLFHEVLDAAAAQGLRRCAFTKHQLGFGKS